MYTCGMWYIGYLTGDKQCIHQDFQRPGSRWIHAECGIYRGFGNVVCSCNFVTCTVKYTHNCSLGRGFKLVLYIDHWDDVAE
jgi:hypothetical protein